MIKKLYYVDSCIWLNIFNDEDYPSRGIYLSTESRIFITRIALSENEGIVLSGFVLKEVKHKIADSVMSDKFIIYMKRYSTFIHASDDDYSFARKLESESGFTISFYDCMHIALCLKHSCILVTRDKRLIELANKYIITKMPEEVE